MYVHNENIMKKAKCARHDPRKPTKQRKMILCKFIPRQNNKSQTYFGFLYSFFLFSFVCCVRWFQCFIFSSYSLKLLYGMCVYTLYSKHGAFVVAIAFFFLWLVLCVCGHAADVK